MVHAWWQREKIPFSHVDGAAARPFCPHQLEENASIVYWPETTGHGTIFPQVSLAPTSTTLLAWAGCGGIYIIAMIDAEPSDNKHFGWLTLQHGRATWLGIKRDQE